MRIGILALQGNFYQHATLIKNISAEYQKNIIDTYFIKNIADCNQAPDALILPGGESSTMAHLLLNNPILYKQLQEYILIQKTPTLATCAGVILLAKQIHNNNKNFPNILPYVDIEVSRNGYGRQDKSFTAKIHPISSKLKNNIHGLFIRAPIIEKTKPNVEILAQYQDKAVLIKQDNILLCTFHPEAINNTVIHQYFIDQI